MAKKKQAPVYIDFETLYRENPDFHVLHFDSHDKQAVRRLRTIKQLRSLKLTPSQETKLLEELRLYQRLLRIEHLSNRGKKLNNMRGVANTLKAAGFSSANEIAILPPHKFIRQYSKLFNGDEEKTRTVYDAAKSIAVRTTHIFANLHHTIASPHFRAMPSGKINSDVSEYFEAIPGYQEMFGSLNYIGSDHCTSIFGPAAYFQDMMRITDEYITDPNTQKDVLQGQPSENIPAAYLLSARRPDLFEMELNCANTNNLTPYLHIVNSVLERRVQDELQFSGKVASVSGSTTILSPGASVENNKYKDMRILITGEPGYGQTRLITAYDAATLTATVDKAWANPLPDGKSTYAIINKSLITGEALAAEPLSIKLASSTPGVDDTYKGMRITVFNTNGSYQTRLITGYTSATTTAIIDKAWDTPAPGKKSIYKIEGVQWQLLANAKYPINLPFNLPLTQIRQYATSLDVTIAEIFSNFNRPLANGKVVAATNTTIKLFQASTPLAKDITPGLLVKITAGSGENQTRTIISYDKTNYTATIDSAWETNPNDKSQFQVIDLLAADREYIGLSIEEYNIIITPETSKTIIAATYGLSSPVPGTPPNKVETFLDYANIDWKRLDELLVLNLSHEELQSGKADKFYINNTGEPGYMKISLDKSDPKKPVYVIENLTWKRIDRLNRFIRLAKVLAWSYSSLNTALDSLGCNATPTSDISKQTIQYLSGIKFLQTNSTLQVEELCCFWSDIKMSGKGNGRYPIDLFDRIFNNPALLNGQDPYQSNPPIPFDPLAPRCMEWDITEATGSNGIIRSRLCAALQVDDNSLISLAEFVCELVKAPPKKFILNLSSLSWLYRISKAAAFFGLKMEAYRILFDLMYPKNASGRFTLPKLTVSEVLAQWQEAQLFRNLPFTVYEIQYLLQGKPSAFFKAPYKKDDIAPLLQTIWNDAATVRLNKSSFIAGDVSTTGSEDIYKDLIEKSLINNDGIVVNNSKSFEVASKKYPLKKDSFPIEDKDRTELIDALKNCYAPILVQDSDESWLLNGVYNENNPLGFIFSNDSNADYKRNLVRSVLSKTKKKIQLQQFNFLFPLNEESFVTNVIDAEESRRIFGLLKTITPSGMLLPILQELPLKTKSSSVSKKTGSLPAYLNPNFEKNISLNFLFPPIKKTTRGKTAALKNNTKANPVFISSINDPAANNDEIKADIIRKILLGKKQGIVNTVEVINNASAMQQQLVLNAVAGLLGTSTELLTMIAPLPDPKKDIRDYVVEFLKPANEGEVSEKVLELVSGCFSITSIFTKLSFTVSEIEALLNKPQGFNISSAGNISYGNLQKLAQFKRLQSAIGDRADVLITSFYLPQGDAGNKDRIKLLAGLTGWKEIQIDALAKELDIKYETVEDIARLKKCFDISLQTELSIDGLLQLESLGKLSLTDDKGNLNQENWRSYTLQSEILQSAVSARFSSTELEMVNTQNIADLNVRKRDALLWYCIKLLNSNGIPMKKPSDLYQYLLIDVEMSGCDNISYIAQAISSIQLYMQRCRLMLEPGVTKLSEIPDIWWAWMSSYRVWEANRKIFLYPENYIDPSLRKNPTPPFGKFADALMQTNITDETVTTAYAEYFDELSDLTRLGNCEGYTCKRTIPGVKEPLDTVFFFGRTNTQPATYFYRTFENQSAWTPWTKMEITINAQLISPVFAFNRLFVFWTEVQEIDTSKMDGNKSIPISSVEATIKYSFLNEQQKWIQPQILKAGIIIDYKSEYDYDSYASPILKNIFPDDKIKAEVFNIDQPYWQAPNAVHIPGKAFDDQKQHPNTESILINYGFKITVSKGAEVQKNLEGPKTNVPASQLSFDDSVHSFAVKYDLLRKNMPQDKTVDLNFLYPIFIDANLNVNSVPAIYTNDTPGANCPRYKPALQRSKNILSVAGISSSNVIAENYYPDNFSSYPISESSGTQYSLLENISGNNASVITTKNRPASFIFDNGDESFFVIFGEKAISYISDTVSVGTPGKDQPFPTGEKFVVWSNGFFATKEFEKLKFEFIRLNTNVVNELNQRLTSGGINKLLTLESQETPELLFSRYKPIAENVVAPVEKLDFNGSYGMYFWETFFHGPFLVAKSLAANQRHEEARRWYQFIYNPTQPPDPIEMAVLNKPEPLATDRFWRFRPFRSMTIETMAEVLTSSAEIMAYNNDPFNPDAIARLRTSAYAKTIVMRYIDNLIEWGDRLFEQDTRESITEAVNLYVMASDLLGERPQQVGEFKTPKSKNFNDIKNEYSKWKVTSGMAGKSAGSSNVELATGGSSENGIYTGMHIEIVKGKGASKTAYLITKYEDRVATISKPWESRPDDTSEYLIYKSGIPEFLIQLENASPAFHVQEKPVADISGVAFNNIDTYFSIPENEEFISYWQKVEDRLFKIRHCMNIRGQVRTLSLFEPPIDPRSIINAGSRDGGFAAPVQIPVYRFNVMIEKAKSLAGTLTNLGNTLLSILEKKDAEALSLLRASQEKIMLNLNTYIKEQQVQELIKQKASLNESLENANYRKSYYDDLIAVDLIPAEVSNIEATKVAMGFGIAASAVKALSAVLYAVPQAGSPFAMTYGGAQLGSVANAASEVLNIGTTIGNYIAQLSLTMAGYERRTSDWQLQSALAKFDAMQIQYQIEANDISQQISEKDLANHKVSIQQSEAIEVFLEKKFTNQELYQWMMTRVSNVYFQTYSLAYELALSAERAYQFELNSDNSFVSYGYWNNLQKGLTAGETLMLALNQMEKSFIDKNNRSLEIEKTISLEKTNPSAYRDFINNGECIFELTEKSFDDDYPGHFARKIKTVSISIPAVVGPYQNIKAILTQLSSQVITKPVVNAVNYLLGGTDSEMPGADELRSNWLVNQQIALSSGVSDDGMFELDFDDDRYLPFEGTGAVSSWKLSMPKSTNHIDFNSISDVIIDLQYTAIDGGKKFRDEVLSLPPMKIYPGSVSLSLAASKSAQWFEFMVNHSNSTAQTMKFGFNGSQPAHVKDAKLTGLYFQLDVADTIKLAPKNSFITLQFTGMKPINIALDNKGQFIHLFTDDIKLKSIEGPCSVNFILNLVQKDLTKNKFLDPALIKDIKLIVFYKGNIE